LSWEICKVRLILGKAVFFYKVGAQTLADWPLDYVDLANVRALLVSPVFRLGLIPAAGQEN
jgi:hypothetical protein